MDDLLDEAGYCLLSDLKPEQCGCANHRHSVGFSTGIKDDSKGASIHHTFRSSFGGVCGLDKSHRIAEGDVMAQVMGRDGSDLGYWCMNCAEALT